MTILQDLLYAQLQVERDRQANLCAVQKSHLEKWLCGLVEEIGEVAKKSSDNKPEEIKTELVEGV